MKNILLVEIKDNKTIVTLTRLMNGSNNLLLHKSYESKPLVADNVYDVSIIDAIKNDLLKINVFESIDESFLIVNSRRTIVETLVIEYKYNTDIEDAKEILKKDLARKYPELSLTFLSYSDTDLALTKKDVTVTTEFIKKDYLEEIFGQYKHRGIIFSKLIPLIKSIENSTKTQSNKEGIIASILVEEKFTQLTILENYKVTSSIKWKMGLTDIYKHISNQMNVKKQIAKRLFKSFGSIPPESVVDNKIIHSERRGKELITFTKKDLSKYITEKVNELFSNVKTYIDPIKDEENFTILFNGEVKSLIGFKKYASKAFAEPNIIRFETNLIGLTEETEFITMGTLDEIKKIAKETNKNEEIQIPKINLINKILRMYNYI